MNLNIEWPKKPTTYILVIEGKHGLECFVDVNEIKKLKAPHIKQLRAFMDGVNDELK